MSGKPVSQLVADSESLVWITPRRTGTIFLEILCLVTLCVSKGSKYRQKTN